MIKAQKSLRFFRRIISLFVVFVVCSIAPPDSGSQVPFQGAPQPQAQIPQRQPLRQQAQQTPSEYAFRPNLTNPEFGECLQLERNWKTLWNSYYQAYYHAQRMSPSDPQYPQMAAYVNNLRYQLDAAWNTFSQKCIYFPR